MAGYLPEAVGSVFESRCRDVELIIVDDGSTDGTAAYLNNLVRTSNTNVTTKIIWIPHSGKSAAVNAGLKQAEGSHITILDADDRLPPGSLQMRMDKARESGADIAVGEFQVFAGDEVGTPRRLPSENRSTLLQILRYGIIAPFHLNSMLIKKTLIEKARAFDESLQRGQDQDYAMSLLKLEPKMAYVHQPVYLYRKYRPLGGRLKIRLQTWSCKMRMLAKHHSGTHKIMLLTWTILVETGKFMYELVGSYKK